MAKHDLLHVGICEMESIQVISITCIFRHSNENYDKKIRQAFQALREWTVQFGLDPKQLLHIGIPTVEKKQIIMYECCVEFPLPMMEDSTKIQLKTLPGGSYAVLRIEKKPTKIGKAIQSFHADYIPDNDLVTDDQRSTYEIYYEDSIELRSHPAIKRDSHLEGDCHIIYAIPTSLLNSTINSSISSACFRTSVQ